MMTWNNAFCAVRTVVLAVIAAGLLSCATAPPEDPVDALWADIVRQMEQRGEVSVIGSIVAVNPRDGFVILQCRVLPKAGQQAKVYNDGAMVALLTITNERAYPYVCADIEAGEPLRGDIVKGKKWMTSW